MCKNKNLKRFLFLGDMPSVNNFLTAYQLNELEHKFPLTVCYCGDCGMVELEEVVNPEYMFKNYVYISSFSKTMLAHFGDLATFLVEKFGLNSGTLVTEIGSNDGTLLKFFKTAGVPLLGVDPAKNLAKLANDNGIETWDDFFSTKLAQRMVREKGHASVIIGTNVFAHIDDLDKVLK
ncbi:MAG: methyltransferase, partial [Patescibacteria group bacterium]